MSRAMVRKWDGAERYDVLNSESSQLQTAHEARETTHCEGRKIEMGGECPHYL
jgi:hypothetical protein